MENNEDVKTQDTSLMLKQSSEQLIEQIAAETDSEGLKRLVAMFNMNIAKKNVLRTSTYQDLLDRITNQMAERFEKCPDEFSHKELLEYFDAMQSAIEKAQKNFAQVDEAPPITLNQQNNNVTVNISDGLSRESKERVADFVRSFLNQQKNTETDSVCNEEEVIDVTEEVAVETVPDSENSEDKGDDENAES